MKKTKPIIKSERLSNIELGLIADSMTLTATERADQSCNDFTFPATAEHRAIGEAIIRYRESENWDNEDTPAAFLAQMTEQKERLWVPDYWAADYFADRCKRLASTTPAGQLSAAELGIIEELLESSANHHEDWYGDGSADLDIALSSSTEHRSLLAVPLSIRGLEAGRRSSLNLSKQPD